MKFEVTLGGIPELSVTTGTVQVTTAENCPLSVCTRSDSMGHESPNEGGSSSEKFCLTVSSMEILVLERLKVSSGFRSSDVDFKLDQIK